MAPPAKKAAAPDPARQKRLLFGVVMASSLVSVVAILWFGQKPAESEHGRTLDPEHLSPDVQDMADAAESFVLFWSTFHYEEASHVSTGDSLARVRLAMDKERSLSAAEKTLARELRHSVEGLSVKLEPTEVVEQDTNERILRARAIVEASDRTVRRNQEFVMVREGGQWLVSSWDPGENEEEEGVEPGLQVPWDAGATP